MMHNVGLKGVSIESLSIGDYLNFPNKKITPHITFIDNEAERVEVEMLRENNNDDKQEFPYVEVYGYYIGKVIRQDFELTSPSRKKLTQKEYFKILEETA